jgi:hypothetical protein
MKEGCVRHLRGPSRDGERWSRNRSGPAELASRPRDASDRQGMNGPVRTAPDRTSSAIVAPQAFRFEIRARLFPGAEFGPIDGVGQGAAAGDRVRRHAWLDEHRPGRAIAMSRSTRTTSRARTTALASRRAAAPPPPPRPGRDAPARLGTWRRRAPQRRRHVGRRGGQRRPAVPPVWRPITVHSRTPGAAQPPRAADPARPAAAHGDA